MALLFHRGGTFAKAQALVECPSLQMVVGDLGEASLEGPLGAWLIGGVCSGDGFVSGSDPEPFDD